MDRKAYEVLNAVRMIDLRIIRLASKREMLEHCLYPAGIRYDRDRVQGNYENQFEKIMGEINIVEQDIHDLVDLKVKKAAEIEILINRVKNEDCKTVLYLRFIVGKKVNEISESMNYSPDWIYKKIRKGVEEIGKIIQ